LQVFAIGFGVDGKFYTLAFVHLIFVLPYVFLSLSDSWRALDKRYDIIATGLGKNRFQVLMSIRIPLLTRAILSAAAVGFAVSVSQYLPTVLIGAGRIDTITTEAISLASGGNRRVIGVYAFLQTLLPFLAFTLVSIIPALLFRNRRAMRV
jgi:putative thiamine transport system permease protein